MRLHLVRVSTSIRDHQGDHQPHANNVPSQVQGKKMRGIHLLYLLSVGPSMLNAGVFQPSPWYPGGDRDIQDMSNKEVLQGTMNLMQDTFCRNCLDFCVDPELAERQLREEDAQFLKAYAILRLIVSFSLFVTWPRSGSSTSTYSSTTSYINTGIRPSYL